MVNVEQPSTVLAAAASPQRMLIVAELAAGEGGTALKLVALQPFSYVLDADAVVSAPQRPGQTIGRILTEVG